MELDARGRLLRAALGFLAVEPREPDLAALHRCFDNWRGIGDVVAGMARQDGVGRAPSRSYQREIVVLGAKTRLPVISAWRELLDRGGLMSYGTSVPAMFRRAATYVDRIMKGAKPGDLPVEQATTFELVVNVKTAKALDLVERWT